MRRKKLANHTMKWTRHALHSCIRARPSITWVLGALHSKHGMQPVKSNLPTDIHIQTPREARIQRQRSWALSPTRRRGIHFTPKANQNLRPKGAKIYAQSDPPPSIWRCAEVASAELQERVQWRSIHVRTQSNWRYCATPPHPNQYIWRGAEVAWRICGTAREPTVA